MIAINPKEQTVALRDFTDDEAREFICGRPDGLMEYLVIDEPVVAVIDESGALAPHESRHLLMLKRARGWQLLAGNCCIIAEDLIEKGGFPDDCRVDELFAQGVIKWIPERLLPMAQRMMDDGIEPLIASNPDELREMLAKNEERQAFMDMLAIQCEPANTKLAKAEAQKLMRAIMERHGA
jgi:hypothetical protein